MKVCLKYLVFTGMMLSVFFSFAQQKEKIAIYFDFDKYEITPKGKATLDSVINIAKNARAYNIYVNAFTDSKGSDQYNAALANNRKKAVAEYFILNRLNPRLVGYSNYNDRLDNIPDDLRRKAIIELVYVRPKTFYGKNGTQVIAGENDNVTISEYFNAKDMISNSKFAIDDNENIIRSDGMITICYGNATLDETGNYYLIKMPSRSGEFNPSMSIYLEVTNEKGEKRWKRTELKPEPDATKKFYVYKIPIDSKGCISINADCIVLPDEEKITYVTTEENYDDVEVRDAKNKLLFSAYINNGVNENQYVFLTKASVWTQAMFFYGYKNKKKTMLRLADFAYTSKPKKDLIPEKEYYSKKIGIGPRSNEDETIEKRGFWPWVKKVFTGKKTYIKKNKNN